MTQPVAPLFAVCEYCAYYASIGGDYGLCRRWPPYTANSDERVYSGGIAGFRGSWPVVCDKDWCGEYDPNPDKMPAPPPIPDPPDGVVSTVEDFQAQAQEAKHDRT